MNKFFLKKTTLYTLLTLNLTLLHATAREIHINFFTAHRKSTLLQTSLSNNKIFFPCSHRNWHQLNKHKKVIGSSQDMNETIKALGSDKSIDKTINPKNLYTKDAFATTIPSHITSPKHIKDHLLQKLDIQAHQPHLSFWYTKTKKTPTKRFFCTNDLTKSKNVIAPFDEKTTLDEKKDPLYLIIAYSTEKFDLGTDPDAKCFVLNHQGKITEGLNIRKNTPSGTKNTDPDTDSDPDPNQNQNTNNLDLKTAILVIATITLTCIIGFIIRQKSKKKQKESIKTNSL